MLKAYDLPGMDAARFPDAFRELKAPVRRQKSRKISTLTETFYDVTADPIAAPGQPPVASLPPALSRLVTHSYNSLRSELIRHLVSPLDSLSSTQIESAQECLKAIRTTISHRRQERLARLTNDYLTLVPHRGDAGGYPFGTVLDTVKKVDDQEERLQLMRDLLHVQDALEAGIDRQYGALGARMCVLGKNSEDYDRIARKIRETHSWRHRFPLRLRSLFAVHLPEERSRFACEGEPIGNIQELFHGTPHYNLLGILSRGLLPTPKNAPCAEALFGKGIYFADESSKSVQNCLLSSARRGSGSGYLLLADVALGRVKRERLACYRESAPHGYESVQGCKGTYLGHNEFVVYRPAQCSLRYIAEIETSG